VTVESLRQLAERQRQFAAERVRGSPRKYTEYE
jgi:hypothetical protein